MRVGCQIKLKTTKDLYKDSMKSTTEFILIQGSFKSDKQILLYIYNGKATSEKKLKLKKQKFLFFKWA